MIIPFSRFQRLLDKVYVNLLLTLADKIEETPEFPLHEETEIQLELFIDMKKKKSHLSLREMMTERLSFLERD